MQLKPLLTVLATLAILAMHGLCVAEEAKQGKDVKLEDVGAKPEYYPRTNHGYQPDYDDDRRGPPSDRYDMNGYNQPYYGNDHTVGWSRFNKDTKLYLPAYVDDTKTIFRAKIQFKARPVDIHYWVPSGTPPPPAWALQAVTSSDVFDFASGDFVGVAESFTVVTRNTSDTGYSSIWNMVIELGPEQNDSLALAGTFERLKETPTLTDGDAVLSGGTNSYLGATGQFIESTHEGLTVVGILIWIVPRLPRFS